jgi:hypothetical protein
MYLFVFAVAAALGIGPDDTTVDLKHRHTCLAASSVRNDGVRAQERLFRAAAAQLGPRTASSQPT